MGCLLLHTLFVLMCMKTRCFPAFRSGNSVLQENTVCMYTVFSSKAFSLRFPGARCFTINVYWPEGFKLPSIGTCSFFSGEFCCLETNSGRLQCSLPENMVFSYSSRCILWLVFSFSHLPFCGQVSHDTLHNHNNTSRFIQTLKPILFPPSMHYKA